MKKPADHNTNKQQIFTFRRWSNKSYSAFLSIGKLIRIGCLKVAVTATLASKSKILLRDLMNIAGISSGDTGEEGPVEEENPDSLPNVSGMFHPGAVLLFSFALSGKKRHHSGSIYFSGNNFKGLYHSLSILFLFCCLILPGKEGLMAQSDTTILLDEVAITGNRIVIPFSEASRNVERVDRRQMEISPVQSIPEILSYVAGVDIRQRGPVGIQTDISIRGGTFEQTLVLVNGIKMTDPQTGHHLMNLPFNMDDVSRIEVLKGPGARIYGQNAFAGAVNFIIGIPERRGVSLRSYAGSFGSYGGSFSLALPAGTYRQYLSAGGDVSDGYHYNTDYKKGNFFYQSEMKLGKGRLVLIGGWTGRKFGANGFYASPDYRDQYEEVRTSLSGVSFEKKVDAFHYQARLYWRWNYDRYLFVRKNPGRYENIHRTNVLGAEWNTSIQTPAGITGVGVEYRREMIGGTWVRNGIESKSNLDGFSRDQAGWYIEQKLRIFRALDVTPGVYINWYSDFGWNLFPGVDLGYGINRKWRLYANIGKSYRVPTFYDQYYESPVEQGNEYLKPEQAWTYEAGLRFGVRGISAEANLFYRVSDNLIDWVHSETDSIWKAQNIRRGRTLGGELAVSLDFNAITGKDLWLKSLSFSYNYIDNHLQEIETIQSRYALENIRNQLIAGLGFRIFRKLKNSFMLRYIERIGQQPYILIDDRLYWEQNNHFMVFLEATNLTDQSYTEVMTPMPGRWIRGGIRWGINF